jgi:hypothetical protein
VKNITQTLLSRILRGAMVQCKKQALGLPQHGRDQADQCMLPAKVYVLGFFEDPKRPLDMFRTSDPLSLLNEHT